MKPRSLTFWLTVYLGLAGLLLIGILGWGMWQTLRHFVGAAEADKTQALANQLAAVSVDAVLLRDYGTIERSIADLAKNRGLAYVELRRADGVILGQAGTRTAGSPVFAATLIAAGEPLGKVIAQSGITPMRDALWQFAVWAGSALLLFTLGMFLLLRRLLAARLVAPVKALIASATPGEIRHAPPAHAPAEVHELAHALADLEARVQTHIAALEDASQAHNDALRRLCAEQRLATVGQMAGEVAHELNTPLANILGYAQMARAQSKNTALDEFLDIIAAQARRAAQIVGDMLTVARAPALAGQALDLADVAHAFVRLVAPLARRQAVVLEVEAAAPAPVWADASRIEQILFNLVTNATQAGAHRVRLVANAGSLRVDDDGSGVPVAVRERLFEPFITSKPAGHGTGLGLAICRRLAEEMRGSLILIESQPGHTVFELQLPTQPRP